MFDIIHLAKTSVCYVVTDMHYLDLHYFYANIWHSLQNLITYDRKFTGYQYTVEYRYNVVQYNMILHTLLYWLRQSMNHSLDPQDTSHTSS